MHAPLLPWQIDTPHQVAALGDLRLRGGGVIRDFHQSYVTHGKLAPDRSNAVLVCSAITGNHHRLDYLIGPGRALDPERCFIIAADPIGNGLTTSPSNSVLQPRMQFPRFTICDMVAAQHRLLTEVLGIERLAAVIGASMGGMQALQWAVDQRLHVGAVVAMTAATKTARWSVAVNEATRACLLADPCWNGTEFTSPPERGWRAWFLVQRVLASRSPESIEGACPDPMQLLALIDEWEAQWKPSRIDAHDFLYQTWAYDAHDVSAEVGRVTARTLLLAPELDLYNPADGVRESAASIPKAHFVEIPSAHGHQSTSVLDLADAEFLNRVIGYFLQITGEPPAT